MTNAPRGRAIVAPAAAARATERIDFDSLAVDDRIAVAVAFDAAYYLSLYRDLACAQTDALAHFIGRGWKELRNPSAAFDTRHYLATNPDIAAAGINPFVHFILRGRAEGRSGLPPGAPRLAPSERSLEAARRWIEAHFDRAHYLNQSPALDSRVGDPILHFLDQGWREGRDPNADFSVRFYRAAYPDVEASGINPFVHYVLHGKAERRRALPFRMLARRMPFAPRISVVVPSYNHAPFLRQRLDSILAQTIPLFEIILLDDASTDGSQAILADYTERHPHLIRMLPNDAKSGNVFAQWKKGFREAKGDLVWICESDDFCAPDFLEHVVDPLRDPSVMIAFGRIQFADEAGCLIAGLDRYREQAERGIWERDVVRPAAEWFRGSFAVANLIPNIGGCVVRNQPVSDREWDGVLQYRICGDWFFLSILARGGQIAFVAAAQAYFRQHQANASGAANRGADYYREHQWLSASLRAHWGTPDAVVAQCAARVAHTYAHSGSPLGPLGAFYSQQAVLDVPRRACHILIASLGFQLGGGEIFPIHLANRLVEAGVTISLLQLDRTDGHAALRAALDPRIAVYDADEVVEMGVAAFVTRAGIDLVNSHAANVDLFFFDRDGAPHALPYVASMHGSYECMTVADQSLMRILRGVKHWIYLSAKNLGHLAGVPIDPARLTRLSGAIPRDPRPAPFTRTALGIGRRDVVFVVASRAIDSKGWHEAIRARAMAARRVRVPIHLLLCGSGPVADALAGVETADPFVHNLGFQEAICGLYRLGDVALLPTRFMGESVPLTLIQAMQAQRPIIATDVGEIEAMLCGGSAPDAGIVIPMIDDDDAFVAQLADAMVRMVGLAARTAFAAGSAERAGGFDMDDVVDRYAAVFRSLLPGALAAPLASDRVARRRGAVIDA